MTEQTTTELREYRVVLERRKGGASHGTTEDTVYATSMEAAEQLAIREWIQAKPRYTFAVLVTRDFGPAPKGSQPGICA